MFIMHIICVLYIYIYIYTYIIKEGIQGLISLTNCI